MPIHLITGIPGHGKTANAVKLLMEAAKRGDRPLYACGIDGLMDGLANPLDDAAKWQDCPDGSLIVVDEAWKWFGHLHDARGKPTPPHVLDLAEHRHRGMDFIWTAQGPGQLYPFVRPLIDQHWHCVRRFGTQLIDVYKWGELVEDVKSQAMRDRAQKDPSALPTETFANYKSASVHTIKARIPWKVWAIPVCFLLAGICAYYVYQGLRPDAVAAMVQGEGKPGLPGDPSQFPMGPRSKAATADEPMTAQGWLDRLLPRFPGLHGSAPVFDQREVLAVPRRFCVISGQGSDTRCGCYTEQVTPLPDVPPTVCLHIARWGEYDAFRGELVAGQPHELFQPTAESPRLSGSRAEPSVVGHPSQGGIQGRKP